VDWRGLLAPYGAAVDWPAAAFWPEIAAAFPEAVILLSTRDAQSWWRSASDTIFEVIKGVDGPWREMVDAMLAARFTGDIHDRGAAIAAFEAHNQAVRKRAPAARLVEWQAGDGWGPICAALGLPIPDLPFPHVNSTEEFQARVLAQRAQSGQ
jgi:hypothetical protein